MQDSIHKYKYLKYKAKYLKLVYGGAVIDVKNAQEKLNENNNSSMTNKLKIQANRAVQQLKVVGKAFIKAVKNLTTYIKNSKAGQTALAIGSNIGTKVGAYKQSITNKLLN
jgi:hypothetical protein